MTFHAFKSNIDGRISGSRVNDATVMVCNGVIGDLMSITEYTRTFPERKMETKFYSLQWTTAPALRGNCPDYDNATIDMIQEFLLKL